MKTRINLLICIFIMIILTITYVLGSESIYINLYDENSPKKEAMLNNPFAIQFNAKSEFDSISIYIANAVSSKEIALTLSLYKWEKDYKTTISKEPVVKEELRQYFKKKEWFSWKLNNTVQSSGEYILYIEKTDTWSLSFNITDNADNRIRLYEGGSTRDGNIESKIHYTENNNLGEISDNNIFLFNDFDRFTATDGLGRTLPGYKEAGGRRENKYVGIFFHTWHDWDATRGTRNITEILKEHPDIKNDFNSPHWGTSPIFHWSQLPIT